MRVESAAADAGENSCPSCHATLARGMRFCRMCGYRLGEGVEEYAATRRFDGKVPPVEAPPRASGPASAGAPFQPANAWGAVAPIQPLTPEPAAGSTFCRMSRRFGPANLGWMFWVILSIVVLTAGGFGILRARKTGLIGGGAAKTAPAPQSFLGVDGFETADGGGAMIEGLAGPDTTVERAGLLGGDIITRFDGRMIEDDDDMRRAIAATPPGKTVEVEFIRDGEAKKTTLTTIARGDFKGLRDIEARPGGRGQVGIDDLDRVRVPGAGNSYGVKLGRVNRNGPADLSGLKKGDIITDFNGKPVRTPGDLRLRIYEAVPLSTVDVVVMRDGARTVIQVKVGRSKD